MASPHAHRLGGWAPEEPGAGHSGLPHAHWVPSSKMVAMELPMHATSSSASLLRRLRCICDPGTTIIAVGYRLMLLSGAMAIVNGLLRVTWTGGRCFSVFPSSPKPPSSLGSVCLRTGVVSLVPLPLLKRLGPEGQVCVRPGAPTSDAVDLGTWARLAALGPRARGVRVLGFRARRGTWEPRPPGVATRARSSTRAARLPGGELDLSTTTTTTTTIPGTLLQLSSPGPRRGPRGRRPGGRGRAQVPVAGSRGYRSGESLGLSWSWTAAASGKLPLGRSRCEILASATARREQAFLCQPGTPVASVVKR